MVPNRRYSARVVSLYDLNVKLYFLPNFFFLNFGDAKENSLLQKLRFFVFLYPTIMYSSLDASLEAEETREEKRESVILEKLSRLITDCYEILIIPFEKVNNTTYK